MVISQLLERDEDDDGLAAAADINFLGSNDVQTLEIGLEIGRRVLNNGTTV